MDSMIAKFDVKNLNNFHLTMINFSNSKYKKVTSPQDSSRTFLEILF